ncbi:MAG TPA: LapA family protein [Burkholderiales bacterium]|nr:LapA family protein [Burkholderiales bacterium]
MRFRTLFLFLVLALTAVFALVNWSAFTAPTTLSLVFGTVTAPLGLIMLGVVFVLGAMALAYAMYVQGTALLESRRHTRELQVQRDLVDNAETSRFTELHRFVGDQLRRMEQLHADTRNQLLNRMDQLEQHTHLALHDTPRHTTVVEREETIERRVANGNAGEPPHRH